PPSLTACRSTLLETNWQCGNNAKIRSVTSDAELGGDTEHCVIPEERVEPYVNAAQQPVRVRQDEVCGVSVGKVSDVETGGNGCGWADGQTGTYPAANDICRVELYTRDFGC